MGKTYNNGINIAFGFNLEGDTPIDDRYVVPSFLDLATIDRKYDGLPSYVQDEKLYYFYDLPNNIWLPIQSEDKSTALISIDNINQVGNQYTYTNILYKVQGIEFLEPSHVEIINDASTDHYRIDILVGDNTGTVYRIEGLESTSAPLQPITPAGTALLSIFNVFEDTSSITPPPIPGIPTLQQVLESGSIGVVDKHISIVSFKEDGNTLGVEMIHQSTLEIYKQNLEGTAGFSLNFNNPGIKVIDTFDEVGMYYSGNFAANNVGNNRWIPDVGWVNEAIAASGGIPTAQQVFEQGSEVTLPNLVYFTIGNTQPTEFGITPTSFDVASNNITFNTRGTFNMHSEDGNTPLVNSLPIITLINSNSANDQGEILIGLQSVLETDPNADITTPVYISCAGFTINNIASGFNSTVDSDTDDPAYIYQTNSITRLGNQHLEGITTYFSEVRAENSGSGSTKIILETQKAFVPIKLEIDGDTGLLITDEVLSKGASYAADYSVNNSSNPLWLTHKGYVDSLVVGVFKTAGNWDASGGTFPTIGTGIGGSIKQGDTYKVSVAGTMGGHTYDIGDAFYSLVNAPGQTTANWAAFDYNTEQATAILRGTMFLYTGIGNNTNGTMTQSAISSLYSSSILQNGNSFGQAVTIGSNDNFNVVLERNNTPIITLTSGSAIDLAANWQFTQGGTSPGYMNMGNSSTSYTLGKNVTGTQVSFRLDSVGTSTGDHTQYRVNNGVIGGVRIDGRMYGLDGTASNDFLTVSQQLLKAAPVFTGSTVIPIYYGDTPNTSRSATFYINKPSTVLNQGWHSIGSYSPIEISGSISGHAVVDLRDEITVTGNIDHIIGGVQSRSLLLGSGNVTTFDGERLTIIHNGSGTVTEGNLLHILAPQGSGTFTSKVGINIDNFPSGINDYSIKTGTGKVQFGGDTNIIGGLGTYGTNIFDGSANVTVYKVASSNIGVIAQGNYAVSGGNVNMFGINGVAGLQFSAGIIVGATITTAGQLLINSGTTSTSAVNKSQLDTNTIDRIKYGATLVTMDGTTFVFNIPHGLGVIPTSFAISFGDASNLNFVQSNRTITSTNIVITCDTPPLVGSQTVYWQVFK